MTTPLRIGIVAHAEMGGSGTVATELAVGLSARGHEVHMITPRRPFRLRDGTGVTVHEVHAPRHAMWREAPWTLALASGIAEVSRAARLDVIHAHFAIPYAVATELACRLLGPEAPPWIATLHGTDVHPLGADPAYRPITVHALRGAARVTAVSEHLKQLAHEELELGADIEVVPNFVDSDRFRPAPDRTPPQAHGPTLVHASNFRPVKRALDVVAIFARVAQQTPARLLLLGDGEERAPALDKLAQLGLADRVDAPGAVKDVERWLRHAHVALAPSERESFGLWALEALSSGVPLVGSRVGGLVEVVEHGKTGFVAEVGDVARMAEHVLALVGDGARWEKMAEAARQRAATRFSPSRALDAYASIYRAALAPSSSR